jgi:hypothetical protein
MATATRKQTLTALKRRIRVGTRLRCMANTLRPILDGTVRTVVKAQGNGFFWTQDGDDKGRSWTPYPGAAGLTWVDDDTFRLALRDGMYVELSFTEPQGEQAMAHVEPGDAQEEQRDQERAEADVRALVGCVLVQGAAIWKVVAHRGMFVEVEHTNGERASWHHSQTTGGTVRVVKPGEHYAVGFPGFSIIYRNNGWNWTPTEVAKVFDGIDAANRLALVLDTCGSMVAELENLLRIFDRDCTLPNLETRVSGEGVRVFVSNRTAERVRELVEKAKGR